MTCEPPRTPRLCIKFCILNFFVKLLNTLSGTGRGQQLLSRLTDAEDAEAGTTIVNATQQFSGVVIAWEYLLCVRMCMMYACIISGCRTGCTTYCMHSSVALSCAFARLGLNSKNSILAERASRFDGCLYINDIISRYFFTKQQNS